MTLKTRYPDPDKIPSSEELEGNFLNVVLETREYGGPEEGGWWYTQKEPLLTIPVNGLENSTQRAMLLWLMRKAYGAFDQSIEDDLISVRAGGFVHVTIDEEKADFEPSRRPHYE